MIVYKAINKNNGRFYIGVTSKDLKDRKWSHEHNAKKGSTLCFHNALRKNDFENFEWKIIDKTALDIKELYALEIKYIAELKPYYNMSSGGEGYFKGKPWNTGKKHTLETKLKMRLVKLGKKRGPHKLETIEKIKKSNLGRKHSEKSKEKIKQKALDQWVKQKSDGYKVKEDTKEKIRKGVVKVWEKRKS